LKGILLGTTRFRIKSRVVTLMTCYYIAIRTNDQAFSASGTYINSKDAGIQLILY